MAGACNAQEGQGSAQGHPPAEHCQPSGTGEDMFACGECAVVLVSSLHSEAQGLAAV